MNKQKKNNEMHFNAFKWLTKRVKIKTLISIADSDG